MSLMEKVKMLNKFILVKRIEGEPLTSTSLILPESPEKGQKGEICAIAEGGDSNIKLKDIVLFRMRAGLKPPIEIDGEKYLHMKQDQVMGIMFGEDSIDVNPLKDNILLEWEFASEYFPGTQIKRPESHKGMHFTGIVKAIGPEVKECAVWDRVFFDQFCGVEKFQEEDKRYAFLQEKDIIAVGLEARKEVLV